MRLTEQQCAKIRSVVELFAGKGTSIFVFGSRIDNARRGGDVDLLIETDCRLDLLRTSRIRFQLEEDLHLPFDVIAVTRETELTPFQTIARSSAYPLP